MYIQEAERLFEDAIRNNDVATLAKFKEFGDTDRRQIHNFAHYDQYLKCGYSDKPSYDKYGRINNDIPKEKVQTQLLWEDGYATTMIEYFQLPNGKWVVGLKWSLAESGGWYGCDMWSSQFLSKNEAIRHELDFLKRQIERSSIKRDKIHMKDVDKARLELRQLSLFG